MFPYLSFLTFLPLVGAAIIAILPKGMDGLAKKTALIFTLPPLVLAGKLFMIFARSSAAFQSVEGPYSWIKSLNVTYFMGADGLSIPMILLTALVAVIAVLASWGIEKHVKAYFALLLMLISGMFGVFCSLDFFLFYVFWEVMLLPM